MEVHGGVPVGLLLLWHPAYDGWVRAWKIPVGFLVMGLLLQYGKEAASSETPLSTPGDSGRDSGQHTPTEDAQAHALIQLGSTMKSQSDLLQTVANRLEKLEEER